MKFRIILAVMLLLFLFWHVVHAREDRRIFALASKYAKADNIDIAFQQYQMILADYPDSKFRGDALFAEGEYYFMISQYQKSSAAFHKCARYFPKASEGLFALLYLFRIAEIQNDELIAERLKRIIVSRKQLGFIFKDSKEYLYRSPLYRHYKAVFQIDKISLYVEGEFFAEISY